MATAIQTRTRLNKSTRPEQKASNSAYRAQLNAKFSFNQLAKAFGANHVVRELVLLMAVTSPAIPHWLVGDTPSRRQINSSLRFETPPSLSATKGFASLRQAYMLSRECRFVFRERANEISFARRRGMVPLRSVPRASACVREPTGTS